jgi:hypothetical protein
MVQGAIHRFIVQPTASNLPARACANAAHYHDHGADHRRKAAHQRRRDKAVDNGGLWFGAMESAPRPPLPTAIRHFVLNPAPPRRAKTKTPFADPVQPNIIAFDPRKLTSGGRHQNRTPGRPIGFVGIRTMAAAFRSSTREINPNAER